MDLYCPLRRGRRAAFSLIEVLVALSVLLTATLAFSRMLTASLALSRADEERVRATEAARRILEEMGDRTFADVLRLYDASNANDPGGAGTGPGGVFDVVGLEAEDADLDGHVGEIVMPVLDEELREDLNEPTLGMPLDLNGDDAIDDADHGADYRLLPVLVRVVWKDRGGPMRVELTTLLAER